MGTLTIMGLTEEASKPWEERIWRRYWGKRDRKELKAQGRCKWCGMLEGAGERCGSCGGPR